MRTVREVSIDEQFALSLVSTLKMSDVHKVQGNGVTVTVGLYGELDYHIKEEHGTYLQWLHSVSTPQEALVLCLASVWTLPLELTFRHMLELYEVPVNEDLEMQEDPATQLLAVFRDACKFVNQKNLK